MKYSYYKNDKFFLKFENEHLRELIYISSLQHHYYTLTTTLWQLQKSGYNLEQISEKVYIKFKKFTS